MTRCPYCQTPIQLNAPECPACRLTFPRTNAISGSMPRLDTIVGDTTGRLKGAAVSRLKKEIIAMQRRYPQLVVQVVMHSLPTEHPFSMYAFWLFNAGAFAGEAKRGRNNHSLLILVDPTRGESAIVPGYGLEPLMTDEATGHILDLAGPAFESHKWETGFQIILEGIDGLLETLSVVSEVDSGQPNDF